MKKYIICFTDSKERYNFFSRIDKVLHKQNTQILFLTNQLSIYLLGKKDGMKISLVRNCRKFIKPKSLKQTVEFHIKTVDHDVLERFYSALFNSMEMLISKYNVIGILNWNGSSLHSLASKDIAKKYKLPILFGEIGNFKDKVFFDKVGTNSDSSIAKNKNLLIKEYRINESEYKKWKQDFIKSRSNLAEIPQAKKKSLKQIFTILLNGFIDEIGYFFRLTVRVKSNSFIRLIRRFKAKKVLEKIGELYSRDLPKKFLFLPLQTSEDTNLILRSGVDNFGAIKKVLAFAKKKKMPLVIKLHPTDTNFEFLEKLYKYLLENREIIVTDINAFILAQKCAYCFTINSTLGLEAMIFGIKVETLGDALYDGWTEEHIKHYITGFLIDMPYFSKSAKISEESVRFMMERFLG